jgi:hypothetical protein
MKKLYYTAIFLVILSGCSSLKITNSWKAQDAVFQNYSKVLVLGLIREADRNLQQNMENHLTGDIKSLGYNAASSIQEYGPKSFDKMDEETAINKLKNSGVDAIITIVLLDKEKERKYIPGNMFYTPYGSYYNRFWGYRSALYQRIYEPGYYVTSTKYFWESNLYDMHTQKLVYSVQTQSFDQSDTESLAHQYGQMIVNNMIKENVLSKQINK